MPDFSPCSCCCASNCDESVCEECDGSTECPSSHDLCVCIERGSGKELPIDGCGDTSRRVLDTGSGYSASLKGCITFDGQQCDTVGGTIKLRSDADTYTRIKLTNDTTGCALIKLYATISGLPAGCSVKIMTVYYHHFGLPSGSCDTQSGEQTFSSNGEHKIQHECLDKCQEVDYCVTMRVAGPCHPCKAATVTISSFDYTVQCPDAVDCTGIDDGCVSNWSCLECCECCMPDSSDLALNDVTKHDTSKECCENTYYFLAPSSIVCNIDVQYGDCTPPDSYCSDTAPYTIYIDCENAFLEFCQLTQTNLSDPIFIYHCDCYYEYDEDLEEDVVNDCDPAGAYYSGEDSYCDNQTEPCSVSCSC